MQSCRFFLPALLACLFVSVSMAETLPRPVDARMSAQVASPVNHDGFGTSVAASTLAAMRGGSEVSENMNLHGTVENNSADHVASGANSISDGAFTGAVGVPMVIQNSGNNVLIQNATIINVQFQP